MTARLANHLDKPDAASIELVKERFLVPSVSSTTTTVTSTTTSTTYTATVRLTAKSCNTDFVIPLSYCQ